ncbi:ATP synthase F0 subunit A [Candidatus Uhrbacteria bacterium CG10_big_fil_rev_8_21_14_0_10_48_11]|uniref:ATP synthase subunit a n=1 Tax=Candidatus Uhrbacteria bacterium CG10_big_fil_rev_8_21_14_0_10_48_11 TaxID=1975037 RepID=A0A2M8LF20_9BACT|nr:MAG: ATP synthase F0 subunit A [Candidatus Uhrbacteria bacterium CG10_big_fil_rev_8_21_14_0_10_48_11]
MFHFPPLAAEVVFHLGNFPVTNSFVNAVVVSVLFIVAAAYFGRRLKPVPSGFQHILEIAVETVLDYMDRVTHDREKSLKFFPIVGTLFFFILLSNWIGVLPGIGSITILGSEHGSLVPFPLFRPANADLNLTVAMAVVAVVGAHVFGVMTIGFWKYADRFIKLGTLWKLLRKGGIGIFVGFIEFFVGLIEIISEVAKVVSLSLRLFGNIFAGEVLLTVMASLIAYAVPLPFLLLEMLVGIIQAMVFAMLALVYLSVATTEMEASH